MGFFHALTAWLLLPPPPADRRAQIHHDGSTGPTHQRPSTRAVLYARRSDNVHFNWTAALRLLTRRRCLSRRRPRGGWTSPTSITHSRQSDASAAAAFGAGLADAVADGSWGTVFWKLSGGAAVIASLIFHVTVRAPVRIGSASWQVHGRPPRRSLLPFPPPLAPGRLRVMALTAHLPQPHAPRP